LKRRIQNTKDDILQKQEILAYQFAVHEQDRRQKCVYKIGDKNRKKSTALIA